MRRIDRRVRGVGAAGLMLGLALTGCATKELSGLTDLDFPILGSVTVTPGAVTLAAGTTHQLTVAAFDTTGAPLTGLAAPSFNSEDTSIAAVDANGTIRAKNPGTVRITAGVQEEEMTLKASTMVTVTASAATAASFALTPEVSTIAVGEGLSLTPTAYTSDGTQIDGIGPASYVSSNPKVARIDNENISAVSRGQVKIIGTMNVYGKQFVDTVTVTVTSATFAYVYIFPANDFFTSRRVTFQPQVVEIAPGGTVVWANYSAYSNFGESGRTSMDVTFDNPNATPDGNIPAETEYEVGRTFPTAGTYTYKSTTNGATGTVIVQ